MEFGLFIENVTNFNNYIIEGTRFFEGARGTNLVAQRRGVDFANLDWDFAKL